MRMLGGQLAADAVSGSSWCRATRALPAPGTQALYEAARQACSSWLGLLQRFWYGSDKRREKFVAHVSRSRTCSA
jgi:geranylgeranyl reductase